MQAGFDARNVVDTAKLCRESEQALPNVIIGREDTSGAAGDSGQGYSRSCCAQ